MEIELELMDKFNLEHIYIEYLHKTKISIEQINYLTFLFNENIKLKCFHGDYIEYNDLISNIENKEFITNSIFSFCSKILKKSIEDWNSLTRIEIIKIINMLKGNIPATENQLKLLTNKKIKIEKDLIRQKDVYIALKTQSKFNIKINETPIEVTKDYEYGIQESDLCENRQMYYIKFFDLMMLDYDHKDIGKIKKCLDRFPGIYRIYETFNGYHVFMTDKRFHYSNKNTINLMKVLECDEYYRKFIKKYGFKIRLSKKLNREEDYIFRFIEIYYSCESLYSDSDGTSQSYINTLLKSELLKEDLELLDLLKLKEKYLLLRANCS